MEPQGKNGGGYFASVQALCLGTDTAETLVPQKLRTERVCGRAGGQRLSGERAADERARRGRAGGRRAGGRQAGGRWYESFCGVEPNTENKRINTIEKISYNPASLLNDA